MNTFNSISVLDTTSTNSIVANNAIINNTFITTSFNTPTLGTNLLTNYTGNVLTLSSGNLININAPFVTITGQTTYANVINLEIKDSLITLNKNGGNAAASGIEIEESGNIISSLKLDSTRDFITASPNNKFTTGNIICTSLNASSNSITAFNNGISQIQIASATGGGTIHQLLTFNTHNAGRGGGIQWTQPDANVKQFFGRAYIGGGNINGLYYNTTTTGEDVFRSGNTTRLFVNDFGNVTCGSITSNSNISGTGAITGSTLNLYSSNISARILPNTDGVLYLQAGTGNVTGTATPIFFGNWFNETGVSARKLMYDASGNVGIGTATPSQRLQVDGNIAMNSLLFSSAISNLSNPFKILTGSFSHSTINAGSSVNSVITFSPSAFSSTPILTASVQSAAANASFILAGSSVISATSSTIFARNFGSTAATTVVIGWVAIGFS